MRVFDIVLYLRNKYLNLKPSESLSTKMGRDGKLCVLVDVPCCPKHHPSHAWSLQRGCPPPSGAGRQERGGGTSLAGVPFCFSISCLLLLSDSQGTWVKMETTVPLSSVW